MRLAPESYGNSKSSKKEVNKKRPSQDGRLSGFGITGNAWVGSAGRETAGLSMVKFLESRHLSCKDFLHDSLRVSISK